MRSTRVAIGVDVGGTKVAVGAVDASGIVLGRESITLAPDATSLVRARGVVIRVIRLLAPTPVVGIGIGVPELVDPAGRIMTNGVVGWTNADVAGALDLGVPITIDSDVRAAAMAEARFGAGRGSSSMLFVNVGTGVSHTLVVDGVPWAGQHGAAILSGSTTLAVLDAETARIVRGRTEDVASGRGVADRYRMLSGQDLDAADVFAAADAGEALAPRIMDDSVELIGSLVANLIDLLDPALVVVGGGLARSDGFVGKVARVARREIWWDQTRQTPIVAAGLGQEAGLVGAALAALRAAPV